MNNLPAPVAHTGAALSIGSWILTFVTSAEPVVAFVCGIVGIISGGFAIAFYSKGMRK